MSTLYKTKPIKDVYLDNLDKFILIQYSDGTIESINFQYLKDANKIDKCS